MSENEYVRVYFPDFSKENTSYFKKEYFADFVKAEYSLDKEEVTELINMMVRFQVRTGCLFKIEEYVGTVFVLTDVSKLCSTDVGLFFHRDKDLAQKIWFSPIPKDKWILNIYEDCFKKRDIQEAPYQKRCCLLDIIKRPKSVSFILDS